MMAKSSYLVGYPHNESKLQRGDPGTCPDEEKEKRGVELEALLSWEGSCRCGGADEV